MVTDGLYQPAAHDAHSVDPVAFKVLVTAPAEQATHGTLDTVLYCPTAQGVQVVAPAAPAVLVACPATQTMQLGWPIPF